MFSSSWVSLDNGGDLLVFFSSFCQPCAAADSDHQYVEWNRVGEWAASRERNGAKLLRYARHASWSERGTNAV